MDLESNIHHCLAMQQIRERIDMGLLANAKVSQIQPASYDPVIGNEIFVLKTTERGFRPDPDDEVFRSLLKMPAKNRTRIDISNGFELKKGYSYLIPLEEKVRLNSGEFIRSSPKSSMGRLFFNTRLLADYNPCFDESHSDYLSDANKDRLLDMWLLVQPLAFNAIVYPGLSFNQIRFFDGPNVLLTGTDLRYEMEKNPVLFSKDENGVLTPEKHIITDGINIHLNLSGQHTNGIIGLKARNNPFPIDLKKKAHYKAEEYFEPLKKNGGGFLTVDPGNYYLIASREVFSVPPHLCIELRANSQIGLSGPLHFAGFIDNGFQGDLVFEVRSDEIASLDLKDNMPVSKLDVFRTQIPDKLYGKEMGSHYLGQLGSRPAKFFLPFDFTRAAKEYKKLDRVVLVQDAKLFDDFRDSRKGFEYIDLDQRSKLDEIIQSGFFHSRYDCEEDSLVLQPIPYLILFDNQSSVFSFTRSSNIIEYGDERLFGNRSIGLGGHIEPKDAPYYARNSLMRTAFSEELDTGNTHLNSVIVGTIMADDKPVDKVHFGLVYATKMENPDNLIIVSKSIQSSGFHQINDMQSENESQFETWSKLLIPHLSEIYNRIKS